MSPFCPPAGSTKAGRVTSQVVSRWGQVNLTKAAAMKRGYQRILGIMFLGAVLGCAHPRSDQPFNTETETTARSMPLAASVVEAGCPTCIYDLPGVEDCRLAAKIDDEFYLMVDSDIDAHAPSGLCKSARKAKATRKIERDKFVTKSFALNSSHDRLSLGARS